MDPNLIIDLIENYNANPQRYSDEEAEFIAQLSNQTGRYFNRDSKPISKALFDLADTATFGLLPNELRPVSRGESVYGQTFSEDVGSLFGMLGGGALGGAGVVRGARGIMNMFRKSPPPFFSDQLRLPGSVQYGRYGTPPRRNLLQLTEGQRSLPGQTRGQLKRNRLPLDSTSGEPIAMGGLRRPAPTDAGRTYRQMKDLYGMDPNRLTDIELAMRRAERFRLEDSIQNMMDLDAVRFG